MNDIFFGILQLTGSALNNKKCILPKDFDWNKAIVISMQHHIAVLIYYGAYNSGIKIPSPYSNILYKYTLQSIQLDAVQNYNFNIMSKSFGDNDIDYLPLKGIILKKYYPKSEMRFMSDIDILIKSEQYAKICNVMNNLGFKFKLESNHEYVWVNNNSNIELHKMLIPSYNKDFYRYYGDGWKHAKCSGNNMFKLNKEDFFIYTFTHLAKHYRDSGIGIKHFLDIWLLIKSEKNFDYKYIERELKKIDLWTFYRNCVKMLDVWFNAEESDEISDFMTNWIFSSGAYGKDDNKELSAALKKTNLPNIKHRQILLYIKKIFPSYQEMKKVYIILDKLPWLLPVTWFIRIMDLIIFKRKNISASNLKLKKLTDHNIKIYQSALEYVGLKFDFKE